ncbi:hypothetical protein, partial [Henriciella pelagia]|uniref:hypothetical protein n=1 Tax=Henriciella pelagia TaxID=1977912 RepID=UPI003512B95A
MSDMSILAAVPSVRESRQLRPLLASICDTPEVFVLFLRTYVVHAVDLMKRRPCNAGPDMD